MAYTYSDSSSKGGKGKPTVPGKHEAQVNYDNLLELGETYTLGEYTFTVTARTIPQTGLMDVIARATGPNGKLGAKTIQIPSNYEVDGWYVEANDTTADIYIVYPQGEYKVVGGIPATGEWQQVNTQDAQLNYVEISSTTAHFASIMYARNQYVIAVSDAESFVMKDIAVDRGTPTIEGTYTASESDYMGQTVYVANSGAWYTPPPTPTIPTTTVSEEADIVPTALSIIMRQTGDKLDSKLVGRFAITAKEAGATAGTDGEENGWEDVDDGQEPIYPGEPGYPDPEDPDYPGDDMPYFPPSKTLTVTINGALSGRHNDPLNDTSYSYLPSDQIAQTQYGSGGIGGNGGGGGAGASTIIVRKFATHKADSKTFILKPKRHGYGSGGGKGGKGGNGCILIYY